MDRPEIGWSQAMGVAVVRDEEGGAHMLKVAGAGIGEMDQANQTWAAGLLLALARDEVAGRRSPRLTEPKLSTWNRFKGRLTTPDLLALLFEDAAVLHPVPFDAKAIHQSLRADAVPEAVVTDWLGELHSLALEKPGPEYILEQARLLSAPVRMARSELHVVKPHQKVLELPGTGGQLAHHLVSSQGDLTLQDNFTVACGTWQELTLAGIVALDLAAPNSEFIVPSDVGALQEAKHPICQKSFDFVVGLHPDKGGVFQIDDQLAIWFPTAKVLLV